MVSLRNFRYSRWPPANLTDHGILEKFQIFKMAAGKWAYCTNHIKFVFIKKNAVFKNAYLLTYARLLAGSMGHRSKLSTRSCAATWFQFSARCTPSSSLPTPHLAARCFLAVLFSSSLGFFLRMHIQLN